MFRINRIASFALVAAAAGYTTTACAQAIEYVRVCDRYGANYYYSPGTNTCINSQTGVTKTLLPDDKTVVTSRPLWRKGSTRSTIAYPAPSRALPWQPP
jgi:hypothetical protein